MKIITNKTYGLTGIQYDMNPEFLDILAEDPCKAMQIIDGLEKFDKKEWREVMHMFAVCGVQRTYDSIHAGEKLQRCDGKERDDENDKTDD